MTFGTTGSGGASDLSSILDVLAKAKHATELVPQLEQQLRDTKTEAEALTSMVGARDQSLIVKQGQIDELNDKLARVEGELRDATFRADASDKNVAWLRSDLQALSDLVDQALLASDPSYVPRQVLVGRAAEAERMTGSLEALQKVHSDYVSDTEMHLREARTERNNTRKMLDEANERLDKFNQPVKTIESPFVSQPSNDVGLNLNDPRPYWEQGATPSAPEVAAPSDPAPSGHGGSAEPVPTAIEPISTTSPTLEQTGSPEQTVPHTPPAMPEVRPNDDRVYMGDRVGDYWWDHQNNRYAKY